MTLVIPGIPGILRSLGVPREPRDSRDPRDPRDLRGQRGLKSYVPSDSWDLRDVKVPEEWVPGGPQGQGPQGAGMLMFPKSPGTPRATGTPGTPDILEVKGI